jgi:hypothetical protein
LHGFIFFPRTVQISVSMPGSFAASSSAALSAYSVAPFRGLPQIPSIFAISLLHNLLFLRNRLTDYKSAFATCQTTSVSGVQFQMWIEEYFLSHGKKTDTSL